MTSYLLLKTLHFLGVVLFLGNTTTGLFFKRHGDRSRDPRVIAAILHGIKRSDRWITLPSAALILGTGFAIASALGVNVLRNYWLLVPSLLLAASGVIYATAIEPLQKRLEAIARAAKGDDTMDWPRYHRLSRWWEWCGIAAVVLPLLALPVMVAKRWFWP